MILKKKLEWNASSGRRNAKVPAAPNMERRLLAFEKLSGHAGLSLGEPHFKGGEYSFYHPAESFELEASEEVGFSDALLVYEAEKAEEGSEVFSPFSFLPIGVEYRIEYNSERSEALISAAVELISFSTGTVFAALYVDDMELLPSARVPLSKGLTLAVLRPVKLARPRHLWPNGGKEQESVYKMSLDIGLGAEKVVRDIREISVWGR